MAGADFTLDGRSLAQLGFKGDPNDTREKVFSDIVHQGFFLNNQKLVSHYVENAPFRLKELLEWGVKVLFSEERAIFTSGIAIMDALLQKARSVGVVCLEDMMVLDLLTVEGVVSGALALDIRKGDFVHFQTGAALIATGGWHKAFWPNTGMRDLSGDGIAIAQRAGAETGNMEFITFCCNILYSPPIWRGSLATYVAGLLCGGELTNSKGEAFLAAYDPYIAKVGSETEWNKSFVSLATVKEVKAGRGSPGGGVYYGRGDVPWEQFERTAMLVFPNWKYKAMDLSGLGRIMKDGGKVEVGPAVEYFDGGIVVNERLETTVQGLYAAGECTLGPFGANRVFSAITEMLVHGATAGQNAGLYATKRKIPSLDARVFEPFEENALLPISLKEGLSPAGVRRRVQEEAHDKLGPIRNRPELETFIRFLQEVKSEELPRLHAQASGRVYNKGWIDALELRNMLQLLETAARSALFRTESRGVHFREDFPFTDNDAWLHETISTWGGDAPEIRKKPATLTDLRPAEGVVPYMQMLKRMMEAHSDTGGHH
jgi:succinate dehydrogenase/fumarate reductase flavoprotein subunit